MRLTAAVMMVWAVSCKTIDPYIATGELEHTVTREVIDTGTRIAQACKLGQLAAAECEGWRDFAVRYKVARALYLKTWRFAVANQDAIEQRKATDIILKLSAELDEYTSLVLALGGVL